MWKIFIITLTSIPSIFFAVKTVKFIDKDENIMNIFLNKEMDISEYPKTTPEENIKFLTYLSLTFLFLGLFFGLIVYFYFK